MRRLAAGDDMQLMECLWEIGDKTYPVSVPRYKLVELINEAADHGGIEESGPTGQLNDLGLHAHIIQHSTGKIGWLFFPTKPECRISQEEILRREGRTVADYKPDPPKGPIN